MSNAREGITRVASHRGKGGGEASVKDGIPYWTDLLTQEPSALPSDWLDSKGNLDAEKALTIYGSYIVARYNIPVATVMEFANVIKQKRDEVDESIAISDNGDDFKTSLVSLEAQRLAEASDAEGIARRTGVQAKKFADTSLKNLQAITPGLPTGPDALYVVEQIMAVGSAILAYNKKQEPAVA